MDTAEALDGSVASTMDAGSCASTVAKLKAELCPLPAQILSFYDCQGHNELQTDTVLKSIWRTLEEEMAATLSSSA